MSTMQAVQNIRWLYVLRILKGSLFVMAIIVPFFQQLGLSMTEIFLTQTAFLLTTVVLEVPSGYLADQVGRVFSLRLGAIAVTLGFLLYALSSGLEMVVAAEILIGVGVAAMSGADSALARETLANLKGRKRAYLRFEARSTSWSDIAHALAAMAGGFVAVYSLLFPFALQVLVGVLTIAAAWKLREQPRREQIAEHPWRDLGQIVKYSLHGHPEIKWLIIYGSVVAATTYTLGWLTQPYFQAVGLPLVWFGVVSAVLFGARAIFARYVEQYEQLLGKTKLLVSFIPIVVVSYVAVAFAIGPVGLGLLLGFYFVRGMALPVFRDYLNDLVGDRIRATVLSVQSLVERLLYAGAGPLIGYVMDLWSLQIALLFSAAFYGVLGLFAIVMMKRAKLL